MTGEWGSEPYNAVELERRLESLVYLALNSRRSVAPPAAELATCPRGAQDRFLAAVEQMARTSVELAYRFARFTPASFSRVSPEDWEDGVLHRMERYDQGGVMACITRMREVDGYVEARRARRSSGSATATPSTASRDSLTSAASCYGSSASTNPTPTWCAPASAGFGPWTTRAWGPPSAT
jgi:hypothetical protein